MLIHPLDSHLPRSLITKVADYACDCNGWLWKGLAAFEFKISASTLEAPPSPEHSASPGRVCPLAALPGRLPLSALPLNYILSPFVPPSPSSFHLPLRLSHHGAREASSSWSACPSLPHAAAEGVHHSIWSSSLL